MTRTEPGDDARAPRPAGAPKPAADPRIAGLAQLIKILAAVLAPTTLVTSLVLYFGSQHAYWFYDYFGVDASVLGLTTQDYLQRSLDSLFVPMLAVAGAGLLALWGQTALRARLATGARPRMLRVLVPATALGGLLLTAGGLWSVVGTTVLDRHLVAAPLSLGFGVLLLVYAMHLLRALNAAEGPAERAGAPQWMAVAEWAGVFVLIGLSLFWAANDYSAAVGGSRARQVVADLPDWPGAVVYSERSLSLHATGVREVRCQDPRAAYHYRYDGLKLLLQSGDQYLFLPEAWTPEDGVAVVLPRNDSLRLEFYPAGAHGPAERSAC